MKHRKYILYSNKSAEFEKKIENFNFLFFKEVNRFTKKKIKNLFMKSFNILNKQLRILEIVSFIFFKFNLIDHATP
jgi:hypothetical protein